jgi:hypothetical protein
MKNACGIKVRRSGWISFHPKDDGTSASLSCWPEKLRRKVRRLGIYSLQRVEKPQRRSITVTIVHTGRPGRDPCPAYFLVPCCYGLCHRFVRELGIRRRKAGTRQGIHLIVTKKKKRTR